MRHPQCRFLDYAEQFASEVFCCARNDKFEGDADEEFRSLAPLVKTRELRDDAMLKVCFGHRKAAALRAGSVAKSAPFESVASLRHSGQAQGWAASYRLTLQNARSLHFADHRFAMICFGRDDRVERVSSLLRSGMKINLPLVFAAKTFARRIKDESDMLRFSEPSLSGAFCPGELVVRYGW